MGGTFPINRIPTLSINLKISLSPTLTQTLTSGRAGWDNSHKPYTHPFHKPNDEPNLNLDSNPNLREGWVEHFPETWIDYPIFFFNIVCVFCGFQTQLTRSIDTQPVNFDMHYVSLYSPLHGLQVLKTTTTTTTFSYCTHIMCYLNDFVH